METWHLENVCPFLIVVVVAIIIVLILFLCLSMKGIGLQGNCTLQIKVQNNPITLSRSEWLECKVGGSGGGSMQTYTFLYIACFIKEKNLRNMKSG